MRGLVGAACLLVPRLPCAGGARAGARGATWLRADASGGARVAFPLPPGLTASEHAALERAGAYGCHPVRLLILGDSIAMTLGDGALGGRPGAYGVTVTDDATVGCDLDPQLQVLTAGAAGPATPGCDNWRGLWPFLIARQRPRSWPWASGAGRSPTTCSTGAGCTSASRPGTRT